MTKWQEGIMIAVVALALIAFVYLAFNGQPA